MLDRNFLLDYLCIVYADSCHCSCMFSTHLELKSMGLDWITDSLTFSLPLSESADNRPVFAHTQKSGEKIKGKLLSKCFISCLDLESP